MLSFLWEHVLEHKFFEVFKLVTLSLVEGDKVVEVGKKYSNFDLFLNTWYRNGHLKEHGILYRKPI